MLNEPECPSLLLGFRVLPYVVAKSMPAPPWPVTIMTLKKRILSCRCRKLNPVGVGWNLARHRNNPNLEFWKMLKIGNDHFETTHLEPLVNVCNRLYVFDAQPPPNSFALVFNPTGKCPAFVVNPKIAPRALEKQRTDELEYAQLLGDNGPVVRIYSGLDGGMNKVFLARFPGRVTLSSVLPYASYLPELPPIPWVDKDGSLTSKLFGTLF